jgi:hypothetical protein
VTRQLRLILTVALLASASTAAQVPVAELAKPPANARHFIIMSTGGQHGDSWAWTLPDGTRMSRESLNLRGQVWEIDTAITPGADGLPARLVVRGVTPTGDAGETFTIVDGRASWVSQIDKGDAAYSSPRFYASVGGTADTNAMFLERLLAAPNRTLDLLPGGQARAEQLTTLAVGAGDKRQTITAWSVTGLSNSPVIFWSDANQKFFGTNAGLAWLPEGYEDVLKPTEKAQNDALAATTAALGASLARVGDADRDHERPHFRCGRRPLPRQPDRRRQPGRHLGCRSGGAGDRAAQRRTHRRRREDARTGTVGLPHARRRRLHRAAGAVDGCHVGARSGEQRQRDPRSRSAARERTAAVPARVSVVVD